MASESSNHDQRRSLLDAIDARRFRDLTGADDEFLEAMSDGSFVTLCIEWVDRALGRGEARSVDYPETRERLLRAIDERRFDDLTQFERAALTDDLKEPAFVLLAALWLERLEGERTATSVS